MASAWLPNMSPLDDAERFVRLAEFFCYTFHFTFGYYFVRKTMRLSLMHPNLRLLMCNLIVEFTLMGVGRLGDYIVAETMAYTRYRTVICVLFKITQDVGLQIAGLTFVWISLERLMATLFIETYEQKTSIVGKVILAVAYTFALLNGLIMAVFDFTTTDAFDPKWSDTCQTTRIHTWMCTAAILGMAVFYAAVVPILLVLYRYNKRMKKTHRNVRLAARYQYSENVATLKVLVPSFLLWGACLLAGLLLIPWYYTAWTDGDRRTQLLVNDVIYLMGAINSVICPLAFVFKYAPLSHAMVSDVRRIPCLGHVVSHRQRHVQPNAEFCGSEADRHFRQLQELWWK